MMSKSDTRYNSRLPSSLDDTSSSLLRRARLSDAVAWNRIVECYSGLVFKWCRSAGLDPDEARDVGQDVFFAAYRKLLDFTPQHDKGSFRGWLRAITHSKVLDYVDLSKIRAQGGNEVRERMAQVRFPPEDEASVRDELIMLHRRIETFIRSEFSARHCEAFFRVSVQEQLPGDVADQLGMSRNAVYLTCTRIRKRVKEEFGELLGSALFC